jgi:hypothetical protein
MEFTVKEYQLPANISFNYEELKADILIKTKFYQGLVYTADQIKDAKKDRSELNKLKKEFNDERIRMEKEYMEPFNVFKKQVNEIISIIDDSVKAIDTQVKEYEEKCKADKLEEIKAYFAEKTATPEFPMPAEALNFNMFFDARWLNSSVTMKAVKTEIDDKLVKFYANMDTLANLPEYGFEAQQMYIATHDFGKAVNEANRLAEMAKRKAEAEAREQERKQAEEAKKSEPIVADVPHVENSESCENFIPTFAKAQWEVLKVNVTEGEKAKLTQYLESQGIQYKFM